jgi:hypothetical protein
MLVDSGKLTANEEAPPAPVLNFQKKLQQAGAKGVKPPVPPGPVAQPPAAQMVPPDKLPDANGPEAKPGGKMTLPPAMQDDPAAADSPPADPKKKKPGTKPAPKGPAKPKAA